MPSGLITAVAPGSLAERMGIDAGDELIAINGVTPRDVIDVRFHAAAEELTLVIARQGQEHSLHARRAYDEPLGLDFARPTFDTDVRRCTNHCDFCFVSQMPKGLRRSLYLKDDDYRHSFLFGSYITLTNLTEADWARIDEQHLSPLYVSVHATEPDLRRRVLGTPEPSDVMAQLRRLAELGIETHTQLVLIPGLNDGPHLDRSIRDLAGLYPSVRSVSVVPVGLTRFHRGGCRTHTPHEAAAVLDQTGIWRKQFLTTIGARLVYPSDEWYLKLGSAVPPAEDYDGLDLTENGVGLVRGFLEDQATCKRRALRRHLRGSTLVTGTLFAPLLAVSIAGIPDAEVIPVVNTFLGETVTVAGLLAGKDVVEQLATRRLGKRVILPAEMFGGPDGQSLDDMLPDEIAAALGRDVRTAHTLSDLLV